MAAIDAITTLLQTWFGSALFFNQLGMEYHFHTTWLLARTPVFLYLVTIAYFTTYYCVLLVADRQIQRRLAHAPRALRLTLRFALCYAIAFGETWFMASGLIDDFFSYRDRHFTLLVGSIGYGWLFFATLPVFTKIERSAGQDRPSLSAVARDALAANMLSLVGYEIFAHVVGKPF